MIDWLLARMSEFGDAVAVAQDGPPVTFREILGRFGRWQDQLSAAGIESGHVVSLEGDYGLDSVAAFLALVDAGCIVAPLSSDSAPQHEQFRELGMIERRVDVRQGQPDIQATGRRAEHPLYEQLRTRNRPGLVLFTSGSTGQSKGVVHDMTALLEKFEQRRHCFRTIVFLQMDHIGGVNTLFYVLSNGGAVVVPASRRPESVCRVIEQHRAELLPTSPTFLNLLLMTDAHRKFDCSSLKRITYGTEPMPQSTLDRVQRAFPGVTLQQTYGMTELGILQSKSREDGSLWVRVGGEGFETKVVEGRLWIRAHSAMLGYLNAPSPFNDEGFFDTGDQVLQDGPWLRILGRASELINVGGSKVFPAEVENALLEMDEVLDAAVHGEPHPLTGSIVAADVVLADAQQSAGFKTKMRLFLSDKLPTYAIPARVRLVSEPLHSSRYKRMRRQA